MKTILLLLLSIALLSCSKKEVAPADTTDALTGTTWEAYGFKSPVDSKDVYYYLEFTPNGKGKSYVKYNRTELSDTPPTVFTYSINGKNLTIAYPAKTSVYNYTGDKITAETALINFVYKKL